MRGSERSRVFALALATIALGVASRRVHLGAMLWDKSVGDVLYAALVYFSLSLIVPRAPRSVVALLALLVCLVIELFQLTGIPVTLAERAPWVHWLLGSTFAVHDLVCYAVGVGLAVLMRRAVGADGRN